MATNSRSRAPWQFSIFTMLVVVALLALGFSLGKLPLGHAGLMLIVLVFLISGHVAGNALGMYLRDQSPLRHEQLPPHAVPLEHASCHSPVASSQQLHARSYPGWWVLVAIIAGVMGGGLGGARVFWNCYESSWSGWLLGTMSAAVIGGILSFITASFLVMFYRVWSEAIIESAKDERGRTK